MKSIISIIASLLIITNLAYSSNTGSEVNSKSENQEININNGDYLLIEKNLLNPILPDISDPSFTGDKFTEVILDEEPYIDDIPFDTKYVITKTIKYPSKAAKDLVEGVVLVSYIYNEHGYIEIVSTNYSDPVLNDYIIQELEKIRLRNGLITVGKEYFIKFNFEIL